jgi:Mg-chelatase subunit ChlD
MTIHSLIERTRSALFGPSYGKHILIETAWPTQDRRCFVLVDCSMSMQGGKLQQAKIGSLGFAARALASGYGVGVIRFASHADLVCGLGQDIERIRGQLQTLHASGTTNMAAAINLARVHLATTEDAIRAIVIATDGIPDNRTSTLQAASKAKDQGIQIIAVGTDKADLAFLRALATAGELAVKVDQEQLGHRLIATARLLPGRTIQ